MSEVNYCHTVYETEIGHPGLHQVGLGLRAGPGPDGPDGRWVAGEAILLAEGDEETQVQSDITLVRPLLTRKEVRRYYVEVTTDERDALMRLLQEAQEYWVLCQYSIDEGSDEDVLLGQLADAGLVVGFGVCWTPGRKVTKKAPQHDKPAWATYPRITH